MSEIFLMATVCAILYYFLFQACRWLIFRWRK